MKEVKLIPFICAGDLSPEAEQWCMDNDYSTHYDNEVVQLWSVEDYDSPFVQWFEETYDYKFDRSKINFVAMYGT